MTMVYSNNPAGFNRASYTSWLAAQSIAKKAPTQRTKILGLFATGHGVYCEGINGLCSWHVKTYLAEMFANGLTTAWTARLADMVAKGDLCKTGETWVDPEGVRRELYFLASDLTGVEGQVELELNL